MHWGPLVATVAVALVATVSAQVAQYCPSADPGVCYSVNIPDQTASSGKGDIFFQIKGPTLRQWIGLGQGSFMAGSNIFIIYPDTSGTNVTLSPRLGIGNIEPFYDNDNGLFLLEGSGIANGNMVAKVRCSDCSSWSGGSMDFTSSQSSWIWASKEGSPNPDSSPSANLPIHSAMHSFSFDLTKARGGSSLNPFAQSSTSTSSPINGSSNTTSQSGTKTRISSAQTQRLRRSTTAHGIVMGLAFVAFFPLGSTIIRLFLFNGLVWVHTGVQLFGFLLAVIGLGLDLYISTNHQRYMLNLAHPVIGLCVITLLQPILGLLHHRIYKATHRPTFWAVAHVWLGRIVLTLSIINGGLGLLLRGSSTGDQVAYGVIACVVWLGWMGVAVRSRIKTPRNAARVIDDKEMDTLTGKTDGGRCNSK